MGLLIILGIGLLIFILSRVVTSGDSLERVQRKDPSGTESKRIQVAICLIRASCLMAVVDGDVDDDEISAIRRFFLSHGADIEFMGFVNRTLVEAMQLLEKQGLERYLETVVATIRQAGLSADEIFYLGDALAAVMVADGRVDDAELQYLYIFLVKAGLQESEVKAYFARFGGSEADDEVESARAVLGLKEAFSAHDVAVAYRSLARRYHPDKVGGLGAEIQQVAHKKMQQLNWARDTLLKSLA